MPTEESDLARVLRALLSKGEVKCEAIDVPTGMGTIQKGYRLTVNSSIIIDPQHERSVQDVIDP